MVALKPPAGLPLAGEERMSDQRGRLAEPEAREERVDVVLEAARTGERDPDVELLKLVAACASEPALIAAALLRDANRD
jgi:hypothetical protein